MFGRQFPEVWRCPRGGFLHVESEFAVKNNKFLQPGSKNAKKQTNTCLYVVIRSYRLVYLQFPCFRGVLQGDIWHVFNMFVFQQLSIKFPTTFSNKNQQKSNFFQNDSFVPIDMSSCQNIQFGTQNPNLQSKITNSFKPESKI